MFLKLKSYDPKTSFLSIEVFIIHCNSQKCHEMLKSVKILDKKYFWKRNIQKYFEVESGVLKLIITGDASNSPVSLNIVASSQVSPWMSRISTWCFS